jgi:hypothetical protein
MKYIVFFAVVGIGSISPISLPPTAAKTTILATFPSSFLVFLLSVQGVQYAKLNLACVGRGGWSQFQRHRKQCCGFVSFCLVLESGIIFLDSTGSDIFDRVICNFPKIFN